MIQNTRCRILGIYTTGHLGFDLVGYTIFLNFCHGKAKAQMEKLNLSSIAKGGRAGSRHDLSNGLPLATMILKENCNCSGFGEASCVGFKKSTMDWNKIISTKTLVERSLYKYRQWKLDD